jgi:phosphohistidine phosphatase SixA
MVRTYRGMMQIVRDPRAQNDETVKVLSDCLTRYKYELFRRMDYETTLTRVADYAKGCADRCVCLHWPVLEKCCDNSLVSGRPGSRSLP